MLSRRVTIVSIFAALVILAVAVSGIALSQDGVPGAAAPPPPKAPPGAEPVGRLPVVAGFDPVAKAPQAVGRPPEDAKLKVPSTPEPAAAEPLPSLKEPAGSGYTRPHVTYGPGGIVRHPSHDGRYGPPTRVKDPEMAKLLETESKLEQETRDLVEEYQKAENDKERAELRGKLEKLCNEHFDVRQQRRQLEVTRLEERLEQIRQAVEKRNEARELIVRVRVSQLLGDVEWDDWALPGRTRGPEAGPPGSGYPGAFPAVPSGLPPVLPPESTSPFSPRKAPPAVPEPGPSNGRRGRRIAR